MTAASVVGAQAVSWQPLRKSVLLPVANDAMTLVAGQIGKSIVIYSVAPDCTLKKFVRKFPEETGNFTSAMGWLSNHELAISQTGAVAETYLLNVDTGRRNHIASEAFDIILPEPSHRRLACIHTMPHELRVAMLSPQPDRAPSPLKVSRAVWKLDVPQGGYNRTPLCWTVDCSGIYLDVERPWANCDGQGTESLWFIDSKAKATAVPIGHARIVRPTVFTVSTERENGVWFLTSYHDSILSVDLFVPSGAVRHITWDKNLKSILKGDARAGKVKRPSIVGLTPNAKTAFVTESDETLAWARSHHEPLADTSLWMVDLATVGVTKIADLGHAVHFYEAHGRTQLYYADDIEHEEAMYFDALHLP